LLTLSFRGKSERSEEKLLRRRNSRLQEKGLQYSRRYGGTVAEFPSVCRAWSWSQVRGAPSGYGRFPDLTKFVKKFNKSIRTTVKTKYKGNKFMIDAGVTGRWTY
jgi:hypothetical protein